MNTLLTISTHRLNPDNRSVAIDPYYDFEGRQEEIAELNILIGDMDEVTIEFVTEITTDAFGSNRKVNAAATYKGDELFELAQSTCPSIIILHLNNILFYTDKYQLNHRIEGVIQVISEIRSKLGIPVIVYSGFEGYEPAVRAAGVEFYFKVPFGIEEFQAAIRATIDKYGI